MARLIEPENIEEFGQNCMVPIHLEKVKIAVIDGNSWYTVVANGKVRYNGNNPVLYYWAKFRTRRSTVRTTIKHGRTFR